MYLDSLLIAIISAPGLVLAAQALSGPAPGTPSCANIPPPLVPGASVLSIKSQTKLNYTVPQAFPTLTHDVNNLNVCEITVALRHAGANDAVTVVTWLPLANWNGRFAAIGGGAWLAGQGKVDLAAPASQGYAVSSTDAGLGSAADPFTPALWALKSDGTTNTDLLTNFASRSIHDMAVVGKSVVNAFYGRPARYSYWNGCSTGGRQGLVAAQQFPTDFNGILAAAPATYWTQYTIAELWPQVVMKEAGYYPSPCEFDAVIRAAISACDLNDKVKDGVINDPLQCHFNPFSLVGQKIHCPDSPADVVITRELASIVRKIWDGPRTSCGSRLWYGLPIGASFSSLANTTVPNGNANTALNSTQKRVGAPFFIPDTWIRYFVKRDPSFDTSMVDAKAFSELFHDSKRNFDKVIGSANPDLRKFKEAGGRLMVWHGLADSLIYPQDSIQYWEEVKHTIGGGASAVDDFFRLFLAPGLDHCGFDPTVPGAKPIDPFASLIAWVENGTAPEYLEAETSALAPSHFTRKICRYPLRDQYQGQGNSNVSSSYHCV
ncbi:hypothetical protein NQ176_g1003 [Zarea fungicola]|uniref:Uncharacterized protein n=1 Tax=Zarea fungicola TaxID=93591 RepID=A0ACC1NUL1_9HYPO|nr:hypothetical protein NQ176_g1003 [Lecanicillium fungicola]